MPNVVLKTPKKCSEAELNMFEKLVKDGGEVSLRGLRHRIVNALYLAWIEEKGDDMIGVAAIKKPSPDYRSSVFKKAGSSEVANQYEFELGWVFIIPTCRGYRLSMPLIQSLLTSFSIQPIFATTRDNNEAMKAILTKFGFQKSGESYMSTNGEHKLILFVREGK